MEAGCRIAAAAQARASGQASGGGGWLPQGEAGGRVHVCMEMLTCGVVLAQLLLLQERLHLDDLAGEGEGVEEGRR